MTVPENKKVEDLDYDLTERKHVENNLRESEKLFRNIFEGSPFSMVMTDKDYLIIKTNAAFRELTGYNNKELNTFTFRNFTHPEHLQKDEAGLLKLASGEIPVYKSEKRYIRKDGTVIWCMTTISTIKAENGEIQYYLGMIEEITFRKKAEEELIAAKEKAEESDRLKTAFLHNVSHEIRTPMNAMIGFSSLLNEPDLSETERKQYIDIIFQSGGQLLSIINDIVDIANVESGQARVNIDVFKVNQAMRSLNEQFSINALQKNISIIFEGSLPDNEAVLMTDGTKLIQIISNLINNAIKFTQKGHVKFGYILKGTFLEFFVCDTGIGIQDEFLKKIFDRFFQVDSAVSRQFSGTGLGLAICKGYVELLGGTIKVDSVAEQGTNFYFTIPFK